MQGNVAACRKPTRILSPPEPDLLARHDDIPYIAKAVVDRNTVTLAHQRYIHLDEPRSPQEFILVYTPLAHP